MQAHFPNPSILLFPPQQNGNQRSDLSSFVNPSVQADALPQFFWKNLEKDLCLLATSLSCSFDDAVLVVHLLFKRIAETPAGDFPGKIIVF